MRFVFICWLLLAGGFTLGWSFAYSLIRHDQRVQDEEWERIAFVDRKGEE